MAVVQVVKYNGTPDMFAWKYPSEELGTWTQVIVNESQEAVLFKSGKALDVLGSGRHTLDTANIPLLNKIINLPFGGRSPFTAEIWYVNKVSSLDIKWGTPTPIQLQDPKYGVFVPVRSFGQFGIRISDSRKFLIKLVGTLPSFDKDNILRYFRGLYVTKVKDSISSYLVHKQISILEINAFIDELSTFMAQRIAPVMDEYGISLSNFYVNDISVPEDDTAVKKLKDALAKRAEMNIIGYNYQQERSFDTMEGAAKNQGTSSTMMGAGMGLGMGAGIAGTFAQQMSNTFSGINTSAETKECPKCHTAMEKTQRFCGNCGCDTFETKKTKTEIIKCSKCGAPIDTNAKFCPECGDQYNPCPKCKADLLIGATKCDVCGYVIPEPCPHCGKLIEKSKSKFCPECGKSLQKSCPKCGLPIDGEHKFCPECGEKL